MTMLTKSAALATALGLLISAPTAFARHADGAWAYARVVRAEPVYKTVRVRAPREVCTEEPVTERVVQRGSADPGAVLFGAMVGGVIGHQFGGGSGKDVATAAGALIGANHAAQHTYRDGHVTERTVYETRCERVHHARYEPVREGYDVTDRAHGRLYHTFTDSRPGSRIRVRVDVSAYE